MTITFILHSFFSYLWPVTRDPPPVTRYSWPVTCRCHCSAKVNVIWFNCFGRAESTSWGSWWWIPQLCNKFKWNCHWGFMLRRIFCPLPVAILLIPSAHKEWRCTAVPSTTIPSPSSTIPWLSLCNFILLTQGCTEQTGWELSVSPQVYYIFHLLPKCIFKEKCYRTVLLAKLYARYWLNSLAPTPFLFIIS